MNTPSADHGITCGWAGCVCTHDGGCSGGWLDNAPATPQGALFGTDATDPEGMAAQAGYDSVRPCPNCAPERYRILTEPTVSTRLQVLKRLRMRADR